MVRESDGHCICRERVGDDTSGVTTETLSMWSVSRVSDRKDLTTHLVSTMV